MAILNFIAGNWDSVLIILCAIGLVVGLIAKGQYAILNKIILALVTEAEKEFGGGTGKMKLGVSCCLSDFTVVSGGEPLF